MTLKGLQKETKEASRSESEEEEEVCTTPRQNLTHPLKAQQRGGLVRSTKGGGEKGRQNRTQPQHQPHNAAQMKSSRVPTKGFDLRILTDCHAIDSP